MHDFLKVLIDYTTSFSQLFAIFVIVVGMAKGLVIFVKDSMFQTESKEALRESRMELGHAFSLGLGFLIGASILKTTFAPSWNDIGQLASIIGIRTVLNFFLTREIERQVENGRQGQT